MGAMDGRTLTAWVFAQRTNNPAAVLRFMNQYYRNLLDVASHRSNAAPNLVQRWLHVLGQVLVTSLI